MRYVVTSETKNGGNHAPKLLASVAGVTLSCNLICIRCDRNLEKYSQFHSSELHLLNTFGYFPRQTLRIKPHLQGRVFPVSCWMHARRVKDAAQIVRSESSPPCLIKIILEIQRCSNGMKFLTRRVCATQSDFQGLAEANLCRQLISTI